MKKSSDANSNSNNALVARFLKEFADQNPDVRRTIAYSLPAYNMLLGLRARSFEEFSLLPLAREQGKPLNNPLFNFEGVFPRCPFCHSSEYISKERPNLYRCRRCSNERKKSVKFAANYNSISSDKNLDALTWARVLFCMLSGFTIARTADWAETTESSVLHIRERLFYAMQLLMNEVRLYGEIRCDITYENASYRGTDLGHDDREEYPEDSPFGEPQYIHREARNRGSANAKNSNEENSIALFTATDGMHSIVRIAGFGHATATKLLEAIPESVYLLSVPDKDPFPFTARALNPPPERSSKSILIGDGENAICAYASRIGIDFESHVYRQNGQQLKLPPGARNIQSVNALHSRLKRFLHKSYPSTGNLVGYLAMFEFLENTKASAEAIGRLFEILASPGLGQPQKFYDNLYKTPNIYIEFEKTWDESGKITQRWLRNHVVAAYMYHQRQLNPKTGPSNREIMERTGFRTSASIRRVYNNIKASGLLEKACDYMENEKAAKAQRKVSASASTAAYLTGAHKIYKDLYDSLCRCYEQSLLQPPFGQLRQQLATELGITASESVIKIHLKTIETIFSIDKLSKLKMLARKAQSEASKNKRLEKEIARGMGYYNRMLESIRIARENGEKPPSKISFYRTYAEEDGCGAEYVAILVGKAKKRILGQC